MNIACIYYIKNSSESICTYNQLQSMCEEKNIDLFIYENDESIEYEEENNKIKFSFDYLKNSLNWNYTLDDMDRGSNFITLLDFYKNHQDYDYYIFYNSRIGYFNKDHNLFDYFDFEHNDAIFESYRIVNPELKYTCNGIDTNIYLNYEGQLHLYALSNNVMSYIYNFITFANDLMGHEEYIVNTLVMTNDLFTISYLNNSLSMDIKDRNLDFYIRYDDIKFPVEEQYDLNYFNNINKYDNSLKYGENPAINEEDNEEELDE